MTVGRLREEMAADEFSRWGVYYGRLAQQAELAQARAQMRGSGGRA